MKQATALLFGQILLGGLGARAQEEEVEWYDCGVGLSITLRALSLAHVSSSASPLPKLPPSSSSILPRPLTNPCLESLVESAVAAGCGEDDAECICGQEDLLLAFRDCAYDECSTTHQAEEVVGFGVHLCEEVGATITLDLVPEGYETGTATATGTSEASATATGPSCAEECLIAAMEAGEEAGCDHEDVECLCSNEDLAIMLRDCAYTCGDEAADLIEYGLHVCEEAGVTVTVETAAPTNGTVAATADATSTAEPTETVVEVSGAGGIAVHNAAAYALVAAAGFAALMV
ncbi:hypothetical protein MKZ38_006169 [Zalerion maritima]|uniref:CFEM domain-containing protein n=1 Tax=Zalerion maritima TaxID=339359 RepID=A0AAD5RJS8_9PEZI|nr:hypothetical protein MKZ38_006169 [Zalerion maritima]